MASSDEETSGKGSVVVEEGVGERKETEKEEREHERGKRKRKERGSWVDKGTAMWVVQSKERIWAEDVE